MLKENVDLVAGDFNGAAWRRDNSNNCSIIEEAFADCALPMPPGPTPVWEPGSIPGTWVDVCGFLKSPESDRQWKVRLHGAFSIHRGVLGLRPNDQSCHHEAWLHLDLSDGMICNPGVRNPVKEFSWKNGRRRTITAGKAGVSVRL